MLITLDGKQVLTLDAEGTSTDSRVLRVKISAGRWEWTQYGGDKERSEALGLGT